jgi:hypothetical protein
LPTGFIRGGARWAIAEINQNNDRCGPTHWRIKQKIQPEMVILAGHKYEATTSDCIATHCYDFIVSTTFVFGSEVLPLLEPWFMVSGADD